MADGYSMGPATDPPGGGDEAPSVALMAAIGDPTRRAILDRLRSGPMPVCDLARGLPVSRPAVSQHLRVLADAGLLTATPRGTRRIYALDPTGMAPLRRWLDALWDDALAQFAARARTAEREGRRDEGPTDA